MIDRSALWLKLIETGIKGKIFNVIKNMYMNAKSCVKNSYELSDFFSCGQGVRQGENLSPLLFAIYLNDFKGFLSEKCEGLSSLNDKVYEQLSVYLRMYVLLYADDTIILSESAEELQTSLNCLHDYCKKWCLNVNISKTKIIIFSRGKIKKYPTFTYGSEVVEVVDDYVYLGVVFNYNGSFKKAIDKQVIQAKKATFSLLQRAKVLKLPIDITLELFNVCVVPILLYGSEIWGYENLNAVDIFHRNFLRMILNSHQFTPKCMLYGESNSKSMSTLVNIRMLNFWNKLSYENSNKFSSTLCEFIKKEFSPDIKHSFKWFSKIKDVFENIDLHFPANMIDTTSVETKAYKEKCNNEFEKNWIREVDTNSQCEFYKIFKRKPAVEKYFLDTSNPLKHQLLKFMMRNHLLPVTYNRFEKENVYEMICPLCDSYVVGDEAHYLFVCKYFDKERKELLPKEIRERHVNDPHIAIQSLLTGNTLDMKKISKFVGIIMKFFENEKKYKRRKELS